MKRLVLPLAVLSVLGLPLLAGLPGLAPSPAAAATPTAAQSLFVPVTPVRLVDTRRTVALGPGGVLDVRVVDGTRVPAGATAVVLTVTATRPTDVTDVKAYPTPADASFPATSNVNTTAGRTVANLVTVRVGERGSVRLRNANGSVHLVVDLSGYFAQGQGSSLTGTSPVRLLDTRRAGGALRGGEVRRLSLSGRVPSGTTAVVLNVTGTAATQQTDVRVYPSRAGAPPLVSNLNPSPGRTAASAVVVPVGADGTVSLLHAAGSLHLVVDLLGHFRSGADGSVLHPQPPVRLLDSRSGAPLGPRGTRDLVVAGAGGVPAPGTVVVLNVTIVRPTELTDVAVYPTTTSGAVPGTSSLNAVAGQTVANTIFATVGRDGSVRLRNGSGSTHLVVDLAGWFGPAGDGHDISWPQCTTAGSSESSLPTGGAFGVVGLTRGTPFTTNECAAAQWRWADALPGEPMVYVNVNAPGPRDSVDGQVWAEVCGTGTPTSTCAREYGERIAAYALERMPVVQRHGGRPMVWLDVEGPYANGPFWQTGYAGAVAVNRGVIQGVVDGLRRAGHRIGTYSDRGSVTGSANDWVAITGGWRLTQMQNWVFRSPDADPQTVCGPEHSFSGGPVVMAQVQPATSPGAVYDVDGLC